MNRAPWKTIVLLVSATAPFSFTVAAPAASAAAAAAPPPQGRPSPSQLQAEAGLARRGITEATRKNIHAAYVQALHQQVKPVIERAQRQQKARSLPEIRARLTAVDTATCRRFRRLRLTPSDLSVIEIEASRKRWSPRLSPSVASFVAAFPKETLPPRLESRDWVPDTDSIVAPDAEPSSVIDEGSVVLPDIKINTNPSGGPNGSAVPTTHTPSSVGTSETGAGDKGDAGQAPPIKPRSIGFPFGGGTLKHPRFTSPPKPTEKENKKP